MTTEVEELLAIIAEELLTIEMEELLTLKTEELLAFDAEELLTIEIDELLSSDVEELLTTAMEELLSTDVEELLGGTVPGPLNSTATIDFAGSVVEIVLLDTCTVPFFRALLVWETKVSPVIPERVRVSAEPFTASKSLMVKFTSWVLYWLLFTKITVRESPLLLKEL